MKNEWASDIESQRRAYEAGLTPISGEDLAAMVDVAMEINKTKEEEK